MRFEFATAQRIVFGEGSVRDVPAAARAFGSRAILVRGSSPERAASLRSSLESAAIECDEFIVPGEPTVDLISSAPRHADLVIAIGGGSVLDAGKAVAALLTNPGGPMDYLEVIGRAQPLTAAAAPCIAIPTTAGTGSEVTRNSVLGSPEHRVKASMRSASILPRLAVVDPELTLQLPRPITVSTGLDALTQLIEPYLSVKANPMTDALCVQGIPLAARALPELWERPGDRAMRGAMSFASLLGGMALANAGLGAVHGFAAPIGGMFSAPHGAVCAALLPYVLEVNLRAAADRKRFDEVARLVTGNAQATGEDGVAWIAELCGKLEVPPLRTYGVAEGDVSALVEKASQASSMKGNPIQLSVADLNEILTRAL